MLLWIILGFIVHHVNHKALPGKGKGEGNVNAYKSCTPESMAKGRGEGEEHNKEEGNAGCHTAAQW